MTRQEYERLSKALDADYAEKKAALKTVFEFSRRSQSKGKLVDRVRYATTIASKPFSATDIIKVLNAGQMAEKANHSSVTCCLSRMVASGELILASKGRGARANLHQRKASP